MSKISIFLTIVLSTLFFSACAPLAQNPDEFRAQFRDSTGMKSITVDKSYKKVRAQWLKNANRCLHKRINIIGGGFGTTYQDYTPKVIEKSGKMVLSVQWHMKDLVTAGGKAPKDGVYLFVADAIPQGKKKTRIDFYFSPTWDTTDAILKAVTAWSKGRDGCPVLVGK